LIDQLTGNGCTYHLCWNVVVIGEFSPQLNVHCQL